VTTSDRNAVTDPVTNGVTAPDAIEAIADAEVEAELAEIRLEGFLGRRPGRFATPGDLNADLLAWARRALAGDRGNLVITGATGTGKTWSAWRLGEELLRHGFRGRVEIASAYQIRQLAAPPTDTDALARLAAAELLALDDIGAVRVSDWDADHLYALIDERWAHRRPVIVIANATEPAEKGRTLLESLLGERVASRIRDGVTVVAMTGADRRQPS
jgi:DNA replication protein DnaC